MNLRSALDKILKSKRVQSVQITLDSNENKNKDKLPSVKHEKDQREAQKPSTLPAVTSNKLS